MAEAYLLLRRWLVGSFSFRSLAILLVAGSSAGAARAEEARAAVRAALEKEAIAPTRPPVLPSLAPERAGKRGEAPPTGADAGRTARERGEARASDAAVAARSDAAARGAQGAAASAAKSANADSHAAAGQARANEARNKPHGPGKNPPADSR